MEYKTLGELAGQATVSLERVLSAHGLTSDRVGTAAAFFELSHWEIHQVVCSCHYGRSMAAGTAAMRVHAMVRRAEPFALSRPGLIAVGVWATAAGLLIAIL